MEDPGPLYYPVTMTVKTTAVVTIGFLLSLILFFSRRLERQKQITLFLGLAFIFFFAVMMTLGEKKFIRYALPALQFVILSAGIGYVYTFRRLTKGSLRTPEQGADTILWLAVAKSVAGETGKFWFDRRERGTHLLPRTQSSARDRQQLWDQCLRLSCLADQVMQNPDQ